jgi:hypothetical protein
LSFLSFLCHLIRCVYCRYRQVGGQPAIRPLQCLRIFSRKLIEADMRVPLPGFERTTSVLSVCALDRSATVFSDDNNHKKRPGLGRFNRLRMRALSETVFLQTN